MASSDTRIDAYIARSADFARPILEHLRALVHRAVPDVEETVKWGMPHFTLRGAIVCGMASFKQHASFGFWRGAQIPDLKKVIGRREKAMGQLGRIASLTDLPSSRDLIKLIKAAAELSRSGKTSPRAPRGPAKVPRTPADLAKALARHAKAKAVWASFPPSHRKEYIEWITGAKAADTRERRLTTAIDWISKGKPQNWRYMKPKKTA